jgi:Na+/proline symporter
MPVGMVGLLISGIFGATMSSMDGGLNKNAGFFVKNFWQIYVHPHASEKELLVTSKITTLVLGVLIILAGLVFANLKDLPIFNLMLNYSAMVSLPVAIPLVMGLFVKRAPAWAGWSTALVTLGTSLITNLLFGERLAHALFGANLGKSDISYWTFLVSVFFNTAAGAGWFMFTCLFAESRPVEEKERIDKFFQMLHTPVDFAKEEGAGSDNLQAKIMGMLSLIYGGFILLLLLVPNPWGKRLWFVFCGAMLMAIGWALNLASKAHAREAERSLAEPQPIIPQIPAGEALANQPIGAPPRGFEVTGTTNKP